MKLKTKILKILGGLWPKHKRDVQEAWYQTYKAGKAVVCWCTALIPAFGKQTQVASSLWVWSQPGLQILIRDNQRYAEKLPAGNVLKHIKLGKFDGSVNQSTYPKAYSSEFHPCKPHYGRRKLMSLKIALWSPYVQAMTVSRKRGKHIHASLQLLHLSLSASSSVSPSLFSFSSFPSSWFFLIFGAKYHTSTLNYISQ